MASNRKSSPAGKGTPRAKKRPGTGRGRRSSSRRPLVSIITPTYNSAATLTGTMQSVLSQTWPNLEYIVVDGGSTDGTLDIVKRFQRKYGARLRYISEPDQGIADAFNKGIRLARGEIIGILNSDDSYLPDTVANAVAAFEEGIGFVFGDLFYIDENDEILYRFVGDAHFEKSIERRMFALNHPSVFVRRSAYAQYGGFDLQYRYAMDLEIILRFHKHGVKGKYSRAIQAKMRLGGASDVHYLDSFREFRDITIRYGTSPVYAYGYYVYACIKAWTRRHLERILSRNRIQRLRSRINPAVRHAPRERLRLCYDGRWCGEHSGTGRVSSSLLAALLDLDRSNTYVVLCQDPDAIPAAPNVETVTVPMGSLFRDQFRLARLSRRVGADMFIAPSIKTSLRIPVPLFALIYDVIPISHKHFIPGSRSTRFFWIYMAYMRRLCRRAARILTISEYSRKQIAAHLGPPLDKIINISCGIGSLPPPPKRRTVAPRQPFVLYVGRFERYKNLEVLVHSFVALLEHKPDMHLVLAGGRAGNDIERLQGIIQRLNLEHCIEMRFNCTDRELSELYQRAELFVLPSEIEGFGMTVIEALLAGTPAIVSIRPPFPEILQEAVLYFDPALPLDLTEKMLALLDNPKLARRLVSIGKKRATHYSWQNTAGLLLDAIERFRAQQEEGATEAAAGNRSPVEQHGIE